MDVLKDSHGADIKRIKKDSRTDVSVCDKQLERCEQNLEEEKNEADKSLKDL